MNNNFYHKVIYKVFISDLSQISGFMNRDYEGMSVWVTDVRFIDDLYALIVVAKKGHDGALMNQWQRFLENSSAVPIEEQK